MGMPKEIRDLDTRVQILALDSITDWLLGLELEPRTTKNYLSIIREILKYAYQKQYIAESPLERLCNGI
jgi:hypothetical protein